MAKIVYFELQTRTFVDLECKLGLNYVVAFHQNGKKRYTLSYQLALFSGSGVQIRLNLRGDISP